jgi:hypothetical protein
VKPKNKVKNTVAPEYDAICKRMSERLGTNVKVSCGKKGNGTITLSFKNVEDLKRIVETLS